MAGLFEGVSPDSLRGLVTLLWGHDVMSEIFQRWNQGFVFSSDEDEPTALLQYDGGPCAVIVPVQAFFLKNLLFTGSSVPEKWRQTSGSERNSLLNITLADILCQAAENSGNGAVVCDLADLTPDSMSVTPLLGCSDNNVPNCSDGSDMCHSDMHVDTDTSSVNVVATKRQRISHEQFHKHIRQKSCSNRDELLRTLQQKHDSFCSDFGVLLFLYSLLLTKGIQRIKSEIADSDEPLIDPVHGHGSQSLINLLLTGKAVSHVWDNEKTVSGLKLQGISAKSDIGFLTLLEHLRYCEVGWYLKNPKYPIWVLGSETHLTVLFSLDRTIVNNENEQSDIRRKFNRFDEDGRGFIAIESLGDLMKSLDLFSVPEYVKLIAEKMDPEQLGIITFDGFVAEFFPELFIESADNAIRPFTVYHYNGLKRSSVEKVTYGQGVCTVPELPELQMISDFSAIKTCLMTKWPTIELSWSNDVIPSLN